MLPHTPFGRTLYLDCDTRVVGDLADLFGVLNNFDLAIAQVVRWHKPNYQRRWRLTVPMSFPQYNGGVLLYRRSPRMIALLEQWRQDYHEAGFHADQVTLREILWTTDARYCALPPQYNVRRYRLVDRLLSKGPKPRILHLSKYNPKRWRQEKR